MTKENFLLGKGERLVEDIVSTRGGGPKQHPYTFLEARTRLTPMLNDVVLEIDQLPQTACPNDQAVAMITLNPEYIAKSYFPNRLFKTLDLEPVGSRPRRITPEKRSRDRQPEQAITTQLFVRGTRPSFRAWLSSLPSWSADIQGAADLVTIEEVAAPTSQDKIKGELPKTGETVFEIVLHADAKLGEGDVLPRFCNYLMTIGVEQEVNYRFYAGGLCFVELGTNVEFAETIATFTPVRALRQMPRLRMTRPNSHTSHVPTRVVEVSSLEPVDPNIRAAIFDGGLPSSHPLNIWVNPLEPTGISGSIPDFQKHGVGVTSAFLFGHIDPSKPLNRPYASVDHYRVLDVSTLRENPFELYRVLDRIDRVLVENEYDFINLSIGPQLPIEDDEVHAWTAVLDDRLSRGTTLATIAVGNDGEGNADHGLNRIQVPADCVNALSVGACDSPETPWQRCSYSSVGPGRSPGLIKPDLVEFGGCLQRPFIVVSEKDVLTLASTDGTSVSAPSVLRLAAGVRAHFGASLSTLAIRALLIHTAEPSQHECQDVGRGRVARSLQDIVLCDDDTIRVVYQGKISPARYIRAPIPVPAGTIPGRVSITATLCFVTEVDPHHPGNYTRTGLEVTFRPHDKKRKKVVQRHADARSFFGKSQKDLVVGELRRDAWKWENCLHGTVVFQGRTLNNPVFDIHYNARLEGRDLSSDKELAYALVLTVQAKEMSDLYDTIVRRYATVIEPLRPIVDIPVTV